MREQPVIFPALLTFPKMGKWIRPIRGGKLQNPKKKPACSEIARFSIVLHGRYQTTDFEQAIGIQGHDPTISGRPLAQKIQHGQSRDRSTRPPINNGTEQTDG